MTTQKLPATYNGIVTRYKGNGRKLGYPTANFKTNTVLSDGVYFGFSNLGNFQHHPSVIFIGVPTTMGDTERRIESYLLDIPDKDYYDLLIQVTLEHFYRSNQTFDSVDNLVEAMKSDEAALRHWLSGSVMHPS